MRDVFGSVMRGIGRLAANMFGGLFIREPAAVGLSPMSLAGAFASKAPVRRTLQTLEQRPAIASEAPAPVPTWHIAEPIPRDVQNAMTRLSETITPRMAKAICEDQITHHGRAAHRYLKRALRSDTAADLEAAAKTPKQPYVKPADRPRHQPLPECITPEAAQDVCLAEALSGRAADPRYVERALLGNRSSSAPPGGVSGP